jgi:hypothetical protein
LKKRAAFFLATVRTNATRLSVWSAAPLKRLSGLAFSGYPDPADEYPDKADGYRATAPSFKLSR